VSSSCVYSRMRHLAGRQTTYGTVLYIRIWLGDSGIAAATTKWHSCWKITIRFRVLSYGAQILTFVGFYYRFVTCAFIAGWQTNTEMWATLRIRDM